MSIFGVYMIPQQWRYRCEVYCNCTQVFNGVFLASSIKTNSEDVSIFEDLGVQGRTLVDIRAEILNPLSCALEDFKSVLSEFKGVKFEMCEMATYTQFISDGIEASTRWYEWSRTGDGHKSGRKSSVWATHLSISRSVRCRNERAVWRYVGARGKRKGDRQGPGRGVTAMRLPWQAQDTLSGPFYD